MGARRFLNLLHGSLLERLTEDGRAELEDAMAEEDRSATAARRIDLLLGAGGEVVMPG